VTRSALSVCSVQDTSPRRSAPYSEQGRLVVEIRGVRYFSPGTGGQTWVDDARNSCRWVVLFATVRLQLWFRAGTRLTQCTETTFLTSSPSLSSSASGQAQHFYMVWYDIANQRFNVVASYKGERATFPVSLCLLVLASLLVSVHSHGYQYRKTIFDICGWTSFRGRGQVSV
jgi:hypothetical protein